MVSNNVRLLVFICLFIGLSASMSAAMYRFEAILTPEAVVPGSPIDDPAGISTASGVAELLLTTGGLDGPTLAYTLSLNGIDFSETVPRPTLSGPDDLSRAVHIHFGAAGENDVHALNVYGFPREDDDDLLVNASNSSLSGLWDDGDLDFGSDGSRGPGDSVPLSDAIDALFAGELYFQVHTFAFRAGEIRGQITQVPEPGKTVMVIAVAAFTAVAFLRRKWR
ncbi:MAG: CHRD domain-containing protein [Verrucomicrobiota bacterium]